jgi:hypothetical protein
VTGLTTFVGGMADIAAVAPEMAFQFAGRNRYIDRPSERLASEIACLAVQD